MATKAQIKAATKKVEAAQQALAEDAENEDLKKALADAQAELDALQGSEKVPALEISTARGVDSFYRAGRRWTGTPVTVPASEFSAEQIKLLKAEKKLNVKETEIEA